MPQQSNGLSLIGILTILLGAARIVVALASGNPEHMALGTIVGIGIAAIGGIAIWVDRHTAYLALNTQRTEGDER